MRKTVINQAISTLASLFIGGLMCVAVPVLAQPSATQTSAKAEAPHDLTGFWVSLVTEDWRFRMMTAEAGDYQGIPLSPLGQQLADAWDPAADLEAGEACRAYGAGGIMRMPTRLHVTWKSDDVLSIETDAGMQTRLLKFGDAQDRAGAGEWQGVSAARWDLQTSGGFGSPVVNGTLEAITTDMRPGYLRRNGVPYSAESSLTEYYEMVSGDNGEEYLIIISLLDDPENLTSTVLTSTNFKREANGDKWDPTPCMVD